MGLFNRKTRNPGGTKDRKDKERDLFIVYLERGISCRSIPMASVSVGVFRGCSAIIFALGSFIVRRGRIVVTSISAAGSVVAVTVALTVGETGCAVMIVCGGKGAIACTANCVAVMTISNRMTAIPCVLMAVGIGCANKLPALFLHMKLD